MDMILFIVVAAIVALVIFLFSRQKKRPTAINKPLSFSHAPAPPAVSEAKSPAYGLAEKLKQSLPSQYAELVKKRVLSAHPGMTEREFEWRWLELQRFFILCAVLDRVPMFSKRIDDVWHEMLMFTREYQAFSEKYLGRMLHHAPNVSDDVPMPGERAWFDLVYIELFGRNPYSELLWGPFLRYPVPRQELELFQAPLLATSQDGRFNAWAYEHIPEAKYAIQVMKEKLQDRIERAKHKIHEKPANFSNTDLLMTSAIFFAWNEPEHFDEHMATLDEIKKDRSGSDCSGGFGCTSNYDDSRSSNNDSHHHCSSGSDGGSGSSCNSGSSCSGGSSCSSYEGGGCSS
ncbi:hypothetical protein ACFQ3W_19735 [Paenibacillus puldeungensis]|uniref:DUF1517 domain-containing protein n=1 Tax=Paenibacillus puldeungensis TaxID=696536 RepID=A0ABW3S2Q9_9BACL